jgi:PAS domain S-box-containing protein
LKREDENRGELLSEIARLKAEVERLKSPSEDFDTLHLELNESEARYRNLVELAVDAIFMGNSQGNIIGANQSAVTLTGYSLEELLGKNLGELFSDEEHKKTPLRYDLLKAGKILQNERMLTSKDGSLVPIGMNSRMMPDGTYHTFMRDYTERKANEEQMLSLIRDLETFTYTISHDLRNPLTPIIGYAEILRENYKEQLDDQGLFYLKEIEKAGAEMLDLMEGLLSLAHAKGHDRPVEPVSVNEVVARVMKRLETHIASVGVVLQVSTLPSVHVPKTYLTQVFDNLIGNAIRYAGNDGGIIEIGGEQKGKLVRFFVRDHGPGIPEHERKHIFDIFYRGSIGEEIKGTGLGLAIVQKIARNCGGEAWVEETNGGGCTFWVEMEGASRP